MRRQSSFLKSFILILGMLAMFAAQWEYSKTDPVLAQAAGAEAGGDVIPQESIRLRILANSDAPADQAVKLRVRDAVVAEMNAWAAEPRTLGEARAYIRERLTELEALAAKTAADAGYNYAVKAELGLVPFPTKAYGGRLYPAGEYEALRITIGRGLGQNWWCVLFPPLCFVDVASGERPAAAGASAIAAAGGAATAGGDEADGSAQADGNAAEDVWPAETLPQAESAVQEEPDVEYRIFLLDVIADAVNAMRGWFAA